MKLSRYMRLHGVTDGELAAAIGRCRTAVLRYRHETSTPPLDVIAQIERATAGEVTFEDFIKEDAA
jgi:hypothetical protein